MADVHPVNYVQAPAQSAQKLQAVLFADVAGSTRLYEAVGDSQAKQLIDACIVVLRNVTQNYGGRVVKTIGDEVMCVLPSADAALLAASEMQNKVMALPVVGGIQRRVRIGFHYGAVIPDGDDVFGDTVNLAARMAGLAKGMQIFTTDATVACLSALLKLSTRPIAALSIRGKEAEVAVSEVIWQDGGELTMATSSIANVQRPVRLRLEHAGRVLELEHDDITLGRDAACEVVIADRNASRRHARIEHRRDKFFLIDQSTNGTFVALANEAELVLRREELMLRGSGRIGFGHSVAGQETEIVAFTVLS